jgi:DNA-binding IclR family transcriptional regulator
VPKPAQSSSTIQKALDILMLFRHKPEWSFSGIQAELGFNKSTLSRILAVLRNNQFLAKNQSSGYELGSSMFMLGHMVDREGLVSKTALPHMRELSRKIGLTVQLGIIEGNIVVVLAKAEPPTRTPMLSRVGSAVPAHCTALGKTLLAFSPRDQVESTINTHGLTRFNANTICTANHLYEELARIKEQGYGVDNSEHERHLVCLAVPILDRKGELVAAISITGTVVDFPDQESQQRILPAIRAARDHIRKDMGYLQT